MEQKDTRTKRNNINKKQRLEALEGWRGTLKPVKHKQKEKPLTQREIIERRTNQIFAPLSEKRLLFTNAIKEGKQFKDIINPKQAKYAK